ncbi:EF-hand calcium-binding domain-containing protein 6 isoform X2 [Heterodontus francisci]|uniref:EF-hand calcium-binding domain-containing protein 6 isoform X2 n=1 Tax=Heterodontus francisci TaxID=7792 RepID=UPI00355B40A0
MVGSSPDLGSLCLESHGMSLTPRPQSTQGRISSRNCYSRASMQSALGSLYSDADLSCSITKIQNILAQRAKEKQAVLRRAFDAYDVDGNLTVTKGEFRRVIEKFLLPLNPKQFQDLLARLSINSDETVPYMVFLEQFCASDGSRVRSANSRCSSIISNCDMTLKQIENHLREKISNNLKNLIRAFKLFDYNKDGHIRCYEVRRVLESYCFRMTDYQFERLCSRYHLTRTGIVNYKQFLEKLGICIEPCNKRVSEGVAQALNWEDGSQEQEKQLEVHRPVIEESAMNVERLSMDEINLAVRKKVRANYHSLFQAFSAFDVTKSGLISVEDLKSVFNNFVFPMSNEIFDGLMDRCNIKTTGKVAWKPFLLNFTESATMENRWAIPKQPKHNSLQDEIVPAIQDTPMSADCRSQNYIVKFDVDPVRRLIENRESRDILQKLHKYFQERCPAQKENHKGIITRQELRRILQSAPLRLTDKQIKDLMLLLDPEHTGIVHYYQILDLIEADEGTKSQNCLNGTTTVNKDTPEEAVWKTVEDILRDKIKQNWKEMQKAFIKCDPESTGTICLAELRKILETYCLSISDQHFEKLCQQQQNNSIQVSYQQFLESLGVSGIPKIIGTEVPQLNQQQDKKRLVKQENEGLILDKRMTVNEVKSELWQRIMHCDRSIRKSFLTHKKQSNGKISKEGFKKVLHDCDIIMEEHQFNILADVLGFKNQDLNFRDFSEYFKDYRTVNPVAALKQCSSDAGDCDMRRMIADDCFNYIADKLKSTCLDLRSVFDQLDRNHDGLVTMYDFRTLLDSCLLTATEYRRFLEMLGLVPESKLTYLDFLKIVKMIESKQGHCWNTSVYNPRHNVDCSLLACEQVHDFLANKAKTRWHELAKAFKQIESDGNLIVQKKDMRDVLYQFCLPISSAEFEKLWSWYDSDKKGFITHLEFLKKLRSRFASQVQTDSKQIVPESKSCLVDHSNKQQQFRTDSTQQRKLQTGTLDITEIKKQLKTKFRNHHKGFNEAFNKLDKSNDGCVTLNDFQRVLKDHNYHLGEEQLKQLLVSLEIPMHNCKFSYSNFLRTIENKSSKHGPKLTFIPPESFQIPSPEKMLSKLKGIVTRSSASLFKAFKSFDKYGNGKINSLAFRQVLHNVCFRLTDREFNYLLSKLKLDSDYMVDWLDFLQSYNIYNYKAAQIPEGQDLTTRPKSSQQLTMNDIMSRIREAVNTCLDTIAQEFEDIDYANIKVISKKDFKEIFFKHFMSLTDEQFENLWNHLPVNDFGNLDYHKFLKQFAGQQLLETQSKGSRSISQTKSLTPRTSVELSQRPASVTPSMNCEAIEQKLKKDVSKFWKEIEKECKEKDTEKHGEIDPKDFKDILKKFCIIIKPEEFQQLAKKYDIKNTGRFAYNEFLQRLVLSLGPLDMNPMQRMRIPHPKIPMTPGTEHEILTNLMMQIQPCITKCWKLMRRTFKAYDETGSGYITLFQFRQVLKQYGINLSEEEFYYLSSYYDKHLQGMISYNEFLRAFL